MTNVESLVHPVTAEKSSTRPVNMQTVLTLRGFVLLCFVVFLISGPVSDKSDIVASVFSFTLLSIIVLSTAFTALRGLLYRSSLVIEFNQPFRQQPLSGAEDDQTPGRPVRLIMNTSPLAVLPFFQLKAQAGFERAGVRPSLHTITGTSRRQRLIFEDLIFPHRGRWGLSAVELSFCDQLGFSEFQWWQMPEQEIAFRIRPPQAQLPALPILSSCHRAGDSVSDIQERHGDPFDLKPYHPSDGMKKILWKIYAKTGDLISRHPERAMTPEGQVVIFCVASPLEDHVCSAAVAYCRTLKELDLEIFFGCEGMRGRAIASSPGGAEDLLIDSVWDSQASGRETIVGEARHLLSSAGARLAGSRLERVIVFCAQERFGSQAGLEAVTALGGELASASISPVFFVLRNLQAGPPPELEGPAMGGAGGWSTELIQMLRGIVVEKEPSAGQSHPGIYNEFPGICARNNWELILL